MKKALAILSFGLAACAANASYLYWQVDPTAGGNTAGSFTYDSARIGWYEASTVDPSMTLAERIDADKTSIGWSSAYDASEGGAMEIPAALKLDDIGGASGAGYVYFIELTNYNDGSPHVAFGEELTYSDLASMGYVSTDLPGASLVPLAWHGGTFNAVPEPTGALLMVFGLAFLGLKRRTA